MSRSVGSWKGDGRRRAAISILLALALLLALAWAAAPAAAGSFQVDPVSIELVQGRRSASLSIRNRDSRPVSIRVRLYRWTQVDGADVYTETNELIASPPIFTVAANARQLIRIGPRAAVAGGAYRVIVEEIPPARAPGSGIQVALRVNLPLHIVPAGEARAALSWRAWRDTDGRIVVEASNSGARHGQVAGLAALDAAGRQTLLSAQAGTVLPGGTRRWNVGAHPQFASGAPLQLSVRGARGQVTRSAIVLEAR